MIQVPVFTVEQNRNEIGLVVGQIEYARYCGALVPLQIIRVYEDGWDGSPVFQAEA